MVFHNINIAKLLTHADMVLVLSGAGELSAQQAAIQRTAWLHNSVGAGSLWLSGFAIPKDCCS